MKRYINKKTIKAMAECLVKTMHPEQIYLFGSYAWGTPTKDSDIDFCLVFRELKTKQVFPLIHKAHDALSEFDPAKDIIIRSVERMESRRPYHAPLESKILRKGKLLYDASI